MLNKLVALINDMHIKSYAEIGVWLGDTSAHVIKNCPRLERVLLVDPWCKELMEHCSMPADPVFPGKNANGLTQLELNFVHQWVKSRFPMESVKVVRDTSSGAWRSYGHIMHDLVFIDAKHEHPYALSDIGKWRHVARRVICGDDYNEEAVAKAVNIVLGEPHVYHKDPRFWWVVLD
ncbi:MAG: class I SAM-dependent methyltransferase [Candidatus Brocadiales bacterium]|nr:class I SAM-dependent methyltransferase [Candidatus Bathyanammoxibius sp.]